MLNPTYNVEPVFSPQERREQTFQQGIAYRCTQVGENGQILGRNRAVSEEEGVLMAAKYDVQIGLVVFVDC